MSLASGTRIGPYEVGAPLGAGGMGEVYRARDTKLGREVAIKVLPAAFANDRERVARFQREAQLLASLNHPHIATIHGLEESDAAQFLVMELVEGGTLADRLRGGALDVPEMLTIARQVADALQAAHEKGIVHRDLKPANIGFTATGQVKVLDFGLAKALGPAEAGHYDTADRGVRLQPDLTHSPTISLAATQAGMILGTAAYMAPEQARGKAADKRSDIWAFGCVLYEMLIGRRAFEGIDIADTLAAVLRSEPDWSALPAATPAPIQALVRACLKKDPRARIADIAAALFVLDELPGSDPARVAGSADAAPADSTHVRTARRHIALAATAALVLGGLVAGGAVWYVARSVRAELPEMRLQVETPPGSTRLFDLTDFAVSPDGRSVIFRGPASGARWQLWMRSLASETAQPLMASDNGARPFWSPDGRAIAFVADGQLKRLELADGRVQTLVSPAAPGGTWSADGTILFARTYTGPLFRIAATGGEVTEVTRLDPERHSGHVFPHFLPDGRHFLFFAFGSLEGKGTYLGSLDSMETRQLVRTDTAPEFAPPDLVLFAQQGALVARRLDFRTWELTGEPMTVARQVTVDLVNGIAAFAASAAGPIAYRSASVERQLVWLDRRGQHMSAVGESDAAQGGGGFGGAGRLSPDGRTLAVSRTVDGNTDVWLLDTARGTLRRFTVDPAVDFGPIWSPDGTRIVFVSDRRAGNLDVYEKPADGQDAEKLLLESPQDEFANDWSPDGRFILYRNTDRQTRRDIWALPMLGDRKPVAIARTPANEEVPRLSFDGRWIAFSSDESGRYEIYVQSFPGPAPKVQISTEGVQGGPQWRGDGREIFYASVDDGRLMAVPVTARGSAIEAGTPVALFTKPEGFFDAAPDGQRFLVAPTADKAYPITILLNWPAGAR